MFKKLAQNKIVNKIFILLCSAVYFFSDSRKIENKISIRNIYLNKQKQKLYELIEKKYKNCYCIFSNHGIGDIFFVASLIKEFKKKNKGKLVYFTEKKGIAKFLKAFPSIDEVVFNKNFKFLQERQTLQKNCQKGKLNKFSFPYRGNKLTYTFADNYNNLLDMPLNTKREMPVISDKNYENAKREFEKLKINPQKTILIIPEATMFDYRTVDIVFWKNLARQLEEKGYDVVFNTKLTDFKKFKKILIMSIMTNRNCQQLTVLLKTEKAE